MAMTYEEAVAKGLRGGDMFRATGGISNEDVKAWEAANPGKKYTDTDGPLTHAEWIRLGHLGGLKTGANDPETIKKARGNKTKWVSPTELESIPWNPTSYQAPQTGKTGGVKPPNPSNVAGQTQASSTGSSNGNGGILASQVASAIASSQSASPASQTNNNGWTISPTGTPYRPVTNTGGQQAGQPASSPSGDSSSNLPSSQAGSTGTESEYSIDHLNRITASDNPYIQAAKQNAKETAAERGLLNSAIAAGAGERAAIEAASPFALQDGAFRQNAALNHQQFRNQAELARYNNQLSIERSAYDVTANTHGEYLAAVEEITKQATISINEIETSPSIKPEDKEVMIQNTIARRDADLAFTRQLYSSMPTWNLSWINLSNMPAPGVS
ncbi:hypothetical protein [Neptunomonas sp. XY-337]|uniref:hypothetical protein n=1 Tax=Neptunomonas sp. XY-337 TaxID=2561897 RepID=UPI0010AA503A|nr:hypothetical protein [Neptunomonas sp. XY-337]